MAFVASQGLVLATQLKVSLRVVKFLFVKTCNLSFAPFVVSVAAVTSLWLLSSMKPGFRTHISAHFFVAVHAQARLRLARHLDVTLLAFVFQFGVPLNNFSGRQNRLDALRTRQPRQSPAPRQNRDEEGKSLASCAQ